MHPSASRSSKRRLLCDLLGTKPNVAISFQRRQRQAATQALEIQRSSDNATKIIGFVGDYVDHATALAFVGAGNDGGVRTAFDQSGNGRDFTQTTFSRMPVLYHAGSVNVHAGGRPAARSLEAVDTSLLRSDLCGLSGSPAITIGMTFSRTAGEDRLFGFGGGSGGGMAVDAEVSRGAFLGFTSGNRQLTYDTTAGLVHSWICKKPLNGTVQTFDIEERGANLVQAAITNPTDTVNLNASFGSALLTLPQFPVGFAQSLTGFFSNFFLFGSVLGADELAALRLELALHE